MPSSTVDHQNHAVSKNARNGRSLRAGTAWHSDVSPLNILVNALAVRAQCQVGPPQ